MKSYNKYINSCKQAIKKLYKLITKVYQYLKQTINKLYKAIELLYKSYKPPRCGDDRSTARHISQACEALRHHPVNSVLELARHVGEVCPTL